MRYASEDDITGDVNPICLVACLFSCHCRVFQSGQSPNSWRGLKGKLEREAQPRRPPLIFYSKQPYSAHTVIPPCMRSPSLTGRLSGLTHLHNLASLTSAMEGLLSHRGPCRALIDGDATIGPLAAVTVRSAELVFELASLAVLLVGQIKRLTRRNRPRSRR